MIAVIGHRLHRVRVAALAAFVLATGLAASDLQAQMRDDDLDRGGPVFGRDADGPPLDHPPIGDPAKLDAAAAERIYRAILPQMQAGYAASGDPLAQAYPRWQRYNTVPYRSQRHGGVFVNHYANAIAADYGRDAAVHLPAGALIVKDSFTVTASGEIRAGALAIMEKMPAGFDPANGDWRYLVIAPDGALTGVSQDDGASPRMAPCAACHNAAPAGQDRLFKVPLPVRR